MSIDLLEEINEGIKEAKRGNTQLGIKLLQDSACFNNVPEAKAWFGYCLAYEKKDFRTGINLCREVLSKNPELAEGYHALGRIYLHSGNRKQAVEILERGLKWNQNQEIQNLLRSIGIRRRPLIPFLHRDNTLNVSLGRCLAKLGLR